MQIYKIYDKNYLISIIPMYSVIYTHDKQIKK